jgi:hypothetical protein
LEDFEDGIANPESFTITGPQLQIVPSTHPNVDSVDGDDGKIDGSGKNARAAWTDANAGDQEITLVKSAPAVGGVLTDGLGRWIVLAYDDSGILVGRSREVELFAPHGGETEEDTFIGFHHAPGIKRLILRKTVPGTSGLETDHIQFGALGSAAQGNCP